MAEPGYVYILSNAAMPNLIKIGKTTRNVEQRAYELYQTGVPEPFDIVHSVYTPNASLLEQAVHVALSDERWSDSREFFETEPSDAVDVVMREHYAILDEWVARYAGEFEVVERKLGVAHWLLEELRHDIDAKPWEIACAIHALNKEEVSAALERAREIIKGESDQKTKIEAVK